MSRTENGRVPDGTGPAPSGPSPTVSGKAASPIAREVLLSLAERCEKATGPDRELSAEIVLAVHDWLHEVEGNKPLNCRLRNSYGSPVFIGGLDNRMHVTASLDAAMTLVPEGCDWLRLSPTSMVIAMPPATDKGWARHIEAAAITPALALCAAALRARAAMVPA